MKDAIIDWGERAILLALFAMFALANIHSDDWVNWAFVALEGLTAFFVLIRRKAISVTESPFDWALALSGTMLPLAIRPGGEPIATWLAGALIVGGGVISVGAKLSLNRRFGIAPANRGVQSNWAYAIVRHPMYLGYIIAQIGYLLHNPTPRSIAIYLAAWMLQLARISREERHLMLDADYRAYAERTRFRLIPGLF